MDPNASVRCADCGFLTLRSPSKRTLDEVEHPIRESWEIPIGFSPPQEDRRTTHFPMYQDRPLCFVMAMDPQEANEPQTQSAALDIIKRPRRCERFTPWKQGFTPKEHQEMLMSIDAIKMQLDFQREQRASDQKFQLEMSEKSNAFQKEQHELNRKAQINSAWMSALIAAVMSAAVAFIMLYLQTSQKAG